MIQDFFSPISEYLLEGNSKDILGNYITKNSEKEGFPDLEEVNVAVFDVRDGRGTLGNEETAIGADEIREEFYQLCYGNWKVSIADLGTINQGSTVSDTYFAVQEAVAYLVKRNVVPIIIGGGGDLIYANYRAYNKLDQTVNIAVASPRFNFGSLEDEINSDSYLSKIILEEPCNLFNYANLGYQTFYNSQEEIRLIDSLSFEAFRVGELKDITIAEPVMRDADMVAFDLGVLRGSEAPGNSKANPNGLYGDDICTLARYAGISDKVTSIGIYEYNKLFDVNKRTSKLVSQLIWYFIEGYSLRTNDYPYGTKEEYLKYMVPFEGEIITFYQSDKSLRWWIQVDVLMSEKHKRHALVPCSYEDYLSAIDQKMPERWYNASKKLT